MQKLNRTTATAAQQYPTRIVQFGEGNFLRAFIDWMVHEMNIKGDFNAGISVVQPIAQGLGEMLNAQDGLYHLYLQGIKDGAVVRNEQLIDCINEVINPYEDYNAYLALAENPELRFVISNTTEAGIVYNEEDKSLEGVHQTFPAKLTALLQKRYETFDGDSSKALAIIPCELIENNGVKLRECILQYAKLWNLSDGFVAWIENDTTFCNTLVDRIVPGFPRDRIAEIQEELGFEDQLVVEGEQFHQFVIQGAGKVQEELPTVAAGLNVIFTDDITPYRSRKVRILNGAHTTMVPVGLLYGLTMVRESMEHEVFGKFVESAVFEEILPALSDAADVRKFAEDVMDRFKNPYIKHALATISLNSFSKYGTRVLPSVIDYQASKGEVPTALSLALASLIYLYKPNVVEGFEAKDSPAIIELVTNLWAAVDSDKLELDTLVVRILNEQAIWGQNLNQIEGFTQKVTANLQAIIAGNIVSLVESVASGSPVA